MIRLKSSTVSRLPSKVSLPKYDRKQHDTGIVHIGIGAFHRAHQAVFTDTALGIDGGNWGICGVSLCRPNVRDLLAEQDFLFTVVEKTASAPHIRLIGSLSTVVFARDDPELLLKQTAADNIRIVTLTVTEKGYCFDPVTGGLNQHHPDIRKDLEDSRHPSTAIGFLTRALADRKNAGARPFSVLSCDNLPENGRLLKRVVLDFAGLIDDKLSQWIDGNVAFPCSMVDRIVPATTEEERQFVEAEIGLRDEAAVLTEPFCQWVVEDEFSAGRPAWDKAGVVFSSEVKKYETMKLRLLNGSHSTLAYLGLLSGLDSISDCMRSLPLKSLVLRMMRDEMAPTISIPAGQKSNEYIQALIERFSNPGLDHRLAQIASEGSLKLPQRLLDPIRDQLKSSGNIDLMTAAVAGWMRYVCGEDEKGDPIRLNDPMAKRLKMLTSNFRETPDDTVMRLMRIKEIFGTDLVKSEVFSTRIKQTFREICLDGAEKTVTRLIQNG